MAVHFDIEAKKKKIQDNNDLMAKDDFWSDQKQAQKIIKENNIYRQLVDTYQNLYHETVDLLSSVSDLQSSYDEEMKSLVDEEFQTYDHKYNDFEIRVLLSGPYDDHNAILEIHPGAGGVEAMDWASMLYRMYCRYAELHGFKVEILDYQPGEEAGIKSVSMRVIGNMAYGYLKAESGVHRLVRISPFDANARRHTSFASVEIMPEFEDDLEIQIDEKDLDIITMRSSGAGGQHINKTDSAVRMTHRPSGITVFSQSQRSQLQNKEACLKTLKSKLLQLKIQEQAKRASNIKGEVKANEWGSQIRSYVFTPYTMVKDLRTGYEVGNIQAVMDGEIEGFIDAYLRSQL